LVGEGVGGKKRSPHAFIPSRLELLYQTRQEIVAQIPKKRDASQRRRKGGRVNRREEIRADTLVYFSAVLKVAHQPPENEKFVEIKGNRVGGRKSPFAGTGGSWKIQK